MEGPKPPASVLQEVGKQDQPRVDTEAGRVARPEVPDH